MQISRNKVATIDYTLTNTNGEVLDRSQEGQPFTYLHGVGGIIPGLENALEGKSPGETVSVTVPPEQGYGPRNEQLVQEVPRKMFQGIETIEPGMQFRAQGPDGQARLVTVVAISPETIRVDANHPLAGTTLKFDVNVVDVRDATAEELAHGHHHGSDGAHH